MKSLAACALACLLGAPLIAHCDNTGGLLAPAPAVLTVNTARCRTQLNEAVRALRGQVAAFAADAFVQNDSVVLSTVGQSASGRMLPPKEILRLQLAPHGCELRLERNERVVALPHCACRAVSGK